jgi:hypothetical protein
LTPNLSDELIHIECQEWWGPSKDKEKKDFDRLKERFCYAPDLIFKQYSFLDKTKFQRKKIFVTSGKPKKEEGKGSWSRLQKFCDENGIEIIEKKTIIKELIAAYSKKYPNPHRVGREVGIARFLLDLIHKGFIDKQFLKSCPTNTNENH